MGSEQEPKQIGVTGSILTGSSGFRLGEQTSDPNRSVSRRKRSETLPSEDRFFICDMETSQDGTVLDGFVVGPEWVGPLKTGSLLEIGPLRIKIQLSDMVKDGSGPASDCPASDFLDTGSRRSRPSVGKLRSLGLTLALRLSQSFAIADFTNQLGCWTHDSGSRIPTLDLGQDLPTAARILLGVGPRTVSTPRQLPAP